MKVLPLIAGLALALAGSAAAAAPTVATAPATSVGVGDATLQGTVNPNGQTTSWWFEYGTSTSYGLKTATRTAGAGTRPVDVSVSLTKLAAGTTYHYRLVASNATATSYGGDQSFVTFGNPGLQTNQPQSVTPTSALLTGSVDPRGSATTWHFDYGTTTSYGLTTMPRSAGAGFGAQPIGVTVSNLSPGTTYHFRLVASNRAGTTYDGDMAFSTPAAVAIGKTALRVVAGQYVAINGNVFGGQAGLRVTILSQPFGESALTPLATVLTGAGGGWTYLAKPRIATTYQASLNGGNSTPITIGVQPRVSLRLISGSRFATRVTAERSFAGKIVQLQRLVDGHWVTLRRARLDASGATSFRSSLLPPGRSTIRVAISVNQAGPGYLAGFSRRLGYRR